MEMIYLDHAATTALHKEVLDEMIPYFTQLYGNAGGAYALGVESKKALNRARRSIAETLQAKPEEIYFTSGGTESDNWAIRGIARLLSHKGKHIITSSIEHPAVLNTCKDLEQEGYQITYLPVDADGFVSPKQVEEAIRKDTILISIMYANNEIGTIQPVQEIAQIAHEHQILFHTDAVQAYGQIPVHVKDGFDLLSASAHKFHGPKGVGFLYIKGYQKIQPFATGGGQENGHRAGTENIPGIVGMAKAAQMSSNAMRDHILQKLKLRQLLLDGLAKELPEKSYVCNGYIEQKIEEDVLDYYAAGRCGKKRMPGNVNISFLGQEAQKIVIHFDLKGICVSGGSACASSQRQPSHVISAISKDQQVKNGAIRFTFGEENTDAQIEEVIRILKEYLGDTSRR